MSKYKPVFWDIETTGFNPTVPGWYNNKPEAEVTAVAIGEITDWTEDGEDRKMTSFSNRGNQEYELISDVRGHVKHIEKRYEENGWVPFLVGHNIIQFDCLYWSARCARYRQDTYPFSSGWRRLDSMRALEIPAVHDDGPKRYPGQQDYADYLGIDYVDRLDGSDMPDAFVNGDYEEILIHVEDDVETLMEIFMQEREAMVDEFWGHYDDNHDDSLEEPRPTFDDSVTIDIDDD